MHGQYRYGGDETKRDQFSPVVSDISNLTGADWNRYWDVQSHHRQRSRCLSVSFYDHQQCTSTGTGSVERVMRYRRYRYANVSSDDPGMMHQCVNL
jgi:hypothetical protein